jgi:hypothetical protein
MPKFVDVVADPLVPSLLEVTQYGHCVESEGPDVPIVNVFHLYKQDGVNPPHYGSIYSWLVSALNGISNGLSVSYIADSSLIRPLDDPTSPGEANPAIWGTGAVSGDRMPSYGAVLCNLITNVRGRCFQGKKRFGPVAESSTTLDELSSAGATTWDEIATDWTAALAFTDDNTNLWRFCVLSRKLSVLTGASMMFTGATITTVLANHVLGTLRRRKQRRGVA